jgi:putative phosphotransacetylase
LSTNSNINIESHKELIDLIVKEVRKIIPSATLNNTLSVGSSQHPPIPLGISNRHIHLTKETFQKLFGENAEFEEMRPLYQPGEFASKHTVSVVGPKLRNIPSIRILGPLRNYDQVEVSMTDAIFLGINSPVANSGTLDNAAPLTLIGPKGSVYLNKCAIIASRHVHMTNADATSYGLKDGDFCKVRVGGNKGTIYENVLVRINDSWKLQIHLDTDDANAANITSETHVEFIGKM